MVNSKEIKPDDVLIYNMIVGIYKYRVIEIQQNEENVSIICKVIENPWPNNIGIGDSRIFNLKDLEDMVKE